MSKNKIIIGLLIVFFSGFIAYNSRPEVKSNTQTTNTQTSNTNTTYSTKTNTPVPTVKTPTIPTSSTTSGGYTMADVAKHSNSSSCWTAVDGGVYDVTSFINQHPGGSGAILSLCGRDGSSAFNDQHGGQRRPENELASLKIGNLK
jgi:cytochrome b involved in lipid metabolism